MKIYCNKCKRYLGEIRDATLRKGIVYICKTCNIQREDINFNHQGDIMSKFNDIFGGRL